MKAKKDDWVRIYTRLLDAGNRAPQVPEDTKKVPFEMWDKGFLQNESAEVGEEVTIETMVGRKVVGTLREVNPAYDHSFGNCVPEILVIDHSLKKIMKEIR